MIKITFVIPYDEIKEDISNLIAETNEKGIEFRTICIIGTQDVINTTFDSDIIIARGVTYLAFKKILNRIPLIEIAVTGYDVIRAIDECKRKYNPKKIAIIGSENMIFGADSLSEIMNIEIVTFTVEDEEDAAAALKIAQKQKVDGIVGGLTVYNFAKNMGIHCVWIKTGKESIRQAIKEAVNAADVTRLERAKSELFKMILENTEEAIIAVDRQGNVTTLNKQAYKILEIPQNRKLVGKAIKNIFPSKDIMKIIETGEVKSEMIETINGIMVVCQKVPITAKGDIVGAVITFQNIDKIQEIESKIRKELSSKGLTAKYGFGNIVGNSKALAMAIQTGYKYSQVDSNVLIIGATGTGKELFAQSIHNASNRNLQPFVAINCAALPENLLESELFGYVEGAFSGAIKGGKIGLFELAHKGTIFLDEIGEIPLNLQTKLLRVLQEKEVRRVGDNRIIPIDVRIISATNKDLIEKVKGGEFRQDLLYRLDVLNLKIPSLEERGDDIKYIAKYFIEGYAKRFNKSIPKLTKEGIEALYTYNWPGNIRELRNICERLVVLTEKDEITENDIFKILNHRTEQKIEGDKSTDLPRKAQHSIYEVEIDTIRNVMTSVNHNKTEAAKILGISRTTLWRKLKE